MKKTICLTTIFIALFAFLSSNQLNAQVSFNHAIGGGYYVSKYGGAPGIFYHPRLNVADLGGRSSDMTLSLGVPLALGFALNSREGASSFALDLPLTAELNFGHAANEDADGPFGGFVGAGFGYSMLAGSDDFGGFLSKSFGPLAHAGVRFMVRERSVGVRAAYMFNVSGADYAASVIGINIFYTFGRF